MMPKLNLGSGPWYAPGWVNVDVQDSVAPDVVANVLDLPFEDDSFDQIYCGHFWEHIPLLDIMGAVTELRRVASAECVVGIVGPCLDLALATNQPIWLTNNIRKTEVALGEEGPGDHHWTPTAAKTKQLLEYAGMELEAVPLASLQKPEWCNPDANSPWQCAFIGRFI